MQKYFLIPVPLDIPHHYLRKVPAKHAVFLFRYDSLCRQDKPGMAFVSFR